MCYVQQPPQCQRCYAGSASKARLPDRFSKKSQIQFTENCYSLVYGVFMAPVNFSENFYQCRQEVGKSWRFVGPPARKRVKCDVTVELIKSLHTSPQQWIQQEQTNITIRRFRAALMNAKHTRELTNQKQTSVMSTKFPFSNFYLALIIP